MARVPDDEKSKFYPMGKFLVTEKPDIYFEFVKLLLKEHPFLVGELNSHKLSFDDGSVLGFFNTVLECDVKASDDMGEGYKRWYRKLILMDKAKVLENAQFYAREVKNVQDIVVQNLDYTKGGPLPGIERKH